MKTTYSIIQWKLIKEDYDRQEMNKSDAFRRYCEIYKELWMLWSLENKKLKQELRQIEEFLDIPKERLEPDRFTS